MKQLTPILAVVAGISCHALTAAPALAEPTGAIVSHMFTITEYPAGANAAPRFPDIGTSIQFTVNNPGLIAYDITIGDYLSYSSPSFPGYSGSGADYTYTLPANKQSDYTATFGSMAAVNGWSYQSDATLRYRRYDNPMVGGDLDADTITMTY